jgi:hypothetical protein
VSKQSFTSRPDEILQLSKTFRFLASQMFHATAIKIVAHSLRLIGGAASGLVIMPCTE